MVTPTRAFTTARSHAAILATLALTLSGGCGGDEEATPGNDTTGAETTDEDATAVDAAADTATVPDTSGPPLTCKSDKDCSPFGLLCDAGTAVCVPCVGDEDCDEGDICVNHACVIKPTDCATAKDCAGDEVCDKSAGVCVGCVHDGDCDADSHCDTGECVAGVCKAGASACDGMYSVKVCDAEGAKWTTKACGKNQACEDGACALVVCNPGDKLCKGNSIVTCGARGTSVRDEQPCKANETCIAGTCLIQICVPNQVVCGEGAILTCATSGAEWKTAPCADEGACFIVDGIPTCKAAVCQPDSLFCEGADVMQCSADGMAVELAGTCSATDAEGKPQTCVGGQCVSAECKPGTVICGDATSLATCKPDGAGWQPIPCPDNNKCLGGGCKAPLCPPGELSCDGQVLKVCNDEADALEVVENCANGGKVCKLGGCVELPCQPGVATCSNDGASINTCKADGSETVQTPCGQGQACLAGKCEAFVCIQAKVYCAGTEVWQCNSNGTGGNLLLPCSGDQVCVDGACVPKSCKAGAEVCDGFAQLAICEADGSSWDFAPCDPGTSCQAGGCKAYVCPPGAFYCAGGKRYHCAVNGQSGTLVEDCAAGGQICTEKGCMAKVCQGGLTKCQDVANQLTCNATGTGWKMESCGPNAVCNSGKCLPQTCEPGVTECVSGKLAACSKDGSGWEIDTCADGKACKAGACVDIVYCPATLVPPQSDHLADVVLFVDPSGSMGQETAAVTSKLNAFAADLTDQGVDHHIVLIGKSTACCELCVPGPLGGKDCSNGDKLLLVVEYVSSTLGLYRLVSEWGKYVDFLRKDASHHFVAVTDDESAKTAEWFITEIGKKLASVGFAPQWTFHSIVGTGEVPVKGCASAAKAGKVYEALSKDSGGMLSPICADDWDAKLATLASYIADKDNPTCSYALPPLLIGETDLLVTLKVTYGEKDPLPLAGVAQLAECGDAGGWTVDNPALPKKLVLCPKTCGVVKGGPLAVQYDCTD